MKLVSLKCPSCGAKLDVNKSLKQYTCNYCGVTTILDDETITVKHIKSKLENKLNEIREYYDNGNYEKAFNLSTALLNEYPNNEEIQEYVNNSLYKHSIDCAKKILKKDYEINGELLTSAIYIDHSFISKLNDSYPDEKVIKEALDKLNPLITECKRIESEKIKQDLIKRGIKAGLVILIVTILFFIIKGCQKEKESYITTNSDEYHQLISKVMKESVNSDMYFNLFDIRQHYPYEEVDIYPKLKANSKDQPFMYEDHVKEITEKIYNKLKDEKFKEGAFYTYNYKNITLNFYGYEEGNIYDYTINNGRWIQFDVTKIKDYKDFNSFYNSIKSS